RPGRRSPGERRGDKEAKPVTSPDCSSGAGGAGCQARQPAPRRGARAAAYRGRLAPGRCASGAGRLEQATSLPEPARARPDDPGRRPASTPDEQSGQVTVPALKIEALTEPLVWHY